MPWWTSWVHQRVTPRTATSSLVRSCFSPLLAALTRLSLLVEPSSWSGCRSRPQRTTADGTAGVTPVPGLARASPPPPAPELADKRGGVVRLERRRGSSACGRPWRPSRLAGAPRAPCRSPRPPSPWRCRRRRRIEAGARRPPLTTAARSTDRHDALGPLAVPPVPSIAMLAGHVSPFVQIGWMQGPVLKRGRVSPASRAASARALHPAMILAASTVEANLVNVTGSLGPLGDGLADERAAAALLPP